MKQEQNNTFTEGLIQDLNPINTPNTVLTDNLNGTIITYDGNEFSLQNDRGNYPLQYCKLKPNYIPVGVKEYADTLYIVSYNPLDNTTEIGSYPSPLEISSSIDNGDNINLPSLIQQSTKIPEYTNLIQKSQLYVFSDDELKLYPGDEYQIKLKDESKYIYEELEYYIIDENRNKYNITEHIHENSGFYPTGWTVPGWMAVQYRLAVFEDFQMNIRSFVVPKLADKSNGKLKLNFQLKISDKLLLDRLYKDEIEQHLDEIGLNIIIKNNNKTKYSEDLLFSDINGNFVEWYESSKILWALKEFDLNELSQGDKIEIIATPFIQVHVENNTYRVNYDNFSENLSISLTNIGKLSDFNLAENNWKFWLEEDDPDNLYLEFDVTGPIITSNDINLYYSISNINNQILVNYKLLDSYDGIGQNMIQIPFDDKFKSEGMYIINFIFSENNPSEYENNNNFKSVKKLVIASQIFSDFVKDVPNFENITFDEWVSKYNNTIKNFDKWGVSLSGTINLGKEYSKGDFDYSGISGINVSDELKDFWKSESYKNKYDHTAFITDDEWNDISKDKVNFIRGYIANTDVVINTELEVLNGPLWDGMNRQISIKLKSHGDVIDNIPYTIGKKAFETKINPIVAKSCLVSYERLSQIVRGSTSRENEYSNSRDELKFGIVMGKTRKSGSNDYIESWFNGFSSNLDTYISSMPKTVGSSKLGELGSKDKIPNTLTGSISNFLSKYNLPFCIIFVIARGVSNKSEMQVFSGDNELTSSPDEHSSMQPFIVFKNKQGNPLFFAIDGWDKFTDPEKITWDKNSNQDSEHGFDFNKWNINEFVRHIKSRIGNLIKYNINNVTDGYFIKCNYTVDDDLILNLETNITIPSIREWNVCNYNLLNALDRDKLSSDLKTNNINTGNLLRGVVSELNSIEVAGLNYNQIVENNNSSKNDNIEILTNKLDKLNNIVQKQYDDWRTDDLFQMEQDSAKGIVSASLNQQDDSSIQVFKQSELYKLIQSSITNSENITLNSTGEKLYFKNSKDDDNIYCIGFIHTSIKFP